MISTYLSSIEDEVLEGADPSDFDDLDIAARKIDPWSYSGRLDDEPVHNRYRQLAMRRPHVDHRRYCRVGLRDQVG